MDEQRARTIISSIAAQVKRWGKHAGFTEFRQEEVLEAIAFVDELGYFELGEERELRIKANRGKAAAEARATKYQKELETLRAIKKNFESTLETLDDIQTALSQAESERDTALDELRETQDDAKDEKERLLKQIDACDDQIRDYERTIEEKDQYIRELEQDAELNAQA